MPSLLCPNNKSPLVKKNPRWLKWNPVIYYQRNLDYWSVHACSIVWGLEHVFPPFGWNYPFLGGNFPSKAQLTCSELVTQSKSPSHCICTSVYCMVSVSLPSPLHHAWHIGLLNKCLSKNARLLQERGGKRRKEGGKQKTVAFSWSLPLWSAAKMLVGSSGQCPFIWLASSAETTVSSGQGWSGTGHPWGSSLLLEAQLLLRHGSDGQEHVLSLLPQTMSLLPWSLRSW